MRKLLLFIGVILCSATVQAQSQTGLDKEPPGTEKSDFLDKVTIRPTIGLNIGFASVKDGNSSDALASFKAGAIADYAVKEDWGFRTGLLLSGQGGKWSQSVGGGALGWSLNATENPWFLEIPINVYADLFRLKDIRFTAFAGFPLEFGLFGNNKIKDGGGGNASVADTSHDAFETYNRFALCLNFGIETEWRKFVLGLEYNRHLTNDSKAGGTQHLNLLSINLGYNFKL